MQTNKCPVIFGGNCPAHMVITSPYFSTHGSGEHFQREEMTAEEKERRRVEILARQEARREARAIVVAENARKREAQKAVEAAAKAEISRRLQEAKRASMLSPEEKRARNLAAAAKARAANIAKAAIRRREKAERKAAEDSVVPQGWVPATVAAKIIGISQSVACKYTTLGFVESVFHKARRYVDPERLRKVFADRQVSNMQALRDNMHKVYRAKNPFCGTVAE